MTEPVSWTAGAVLALLTAIFGFVKWLLPFLRQMQLDKWRRRTEQGARDIQSMYDEMDAILNNGAQRVIIFSGHNSGGLPRPGAPFYVSAQHWSFDGPARWSPERYQELPVDGEYANMLVSIMDKGHVRYTTEEMEPCQLRDIYKAEGVTDSLVLYLGSRDKQLRYMSVALYHGTFTDNQITEIRIRANTIRRLVCP